MKNNPSIADETAPLTGGDHDLSQRAVCPSCHTVYPSLTSEGLAAGVSWTCVRCGERWNATRLATVAAYKVWAAERDKPATAGAAPRATS